MSFLPNSIDLLEDETLESALIRLYKANHFEHYNDLSIEIKTWLEEHHPTVAGAFPLALDAVNVYHAKQSSAKRVQALQLLEQLVGLPAYFGDCERLFRFIPNTWTSTFSLSLFLL